MRTLTEPLSERRYSNRQLVRRLWPFMRPLKWHFLGAFLMLLASRALMLAGPLLVRHAIDQDIPNRDQSGLQLTVGWYLAAQLLNLAVIYVMRNWMEWNGQSLMAELRIRLFDHLVDMPVSFHDRHSAGQLMARVESDTQSLQMLFTTTAVMLVGDAMFFVGMLGVMMSVSVRLTFAISFMLPAMILVTLYFQRRIHPVFVDVRKWNSEVSGRLTELLQLMPMIQALRTQAWALAEFFRVNRSKYEVNLPGERMVVLWFNLVFFLQSLTFTVILALGGYWALAGLVTIGTLAMFMGYVRRFFEPLMRLSEQLAAIQKAFAGAERIFQLLEQEPELKDPVTPLATPQLEHSIAFEDVWFRYSEQGEWVLKGVSFTIPAGQRWALVGPTGSGKTTIISLLLRFHDPQRGRITIDSVDIRSIPQADLRQLIGLVPQEIFVFPGPLRNNLTLGDSTLEPRLPATARLTMADTLIENLPGGYDEELQERGGNLSVGQRQLLSYTRALIREPRLLILDEATSSVDPQTERLLTRATRRALAGRTALIIAHRLATVRDCDWILVLESGEIAEQGNHARLVESQGLYHQLCALQAGHGLQQASVQDQQ